jgi:hypothetical protein
MSYKGTYTPKNRHKYIGNSERVIYRSLWERNVMRWIDENDDIVQFSSEEIVVPYFDESTNVHRKYFVDLWFKTKDGKTYLIEIKPHRECVPPKTKVSSKKYLSEAMEYIKNQSKWKAAKMFAEKHGWEFQVWTEKTIKNLGIKI